MSPRGLSEKDSKSNKIIYLRKQTSSPLHDISLKDENKNFIVKLKVSPVADLLFAINLLGGKRVVSIAKLSRATKKDRLINRLP